MINTHQCEDQGWKYRETYSAYKTGCTFDPLHYRDIPVVKKNAITNLIICDLELSEFFSNIATLHVGLCVLNAKLFKVSETIQVSLEKGKRSFRIWKAWTPTVGTEMTHLPEYKVFSDDCLNSLVTPNISV